MTMRKVLIAAAFAVAFAGTAFADAFSSPFYVAIDRSSGHCVMMQFMGAGGPDTHRYKIMGSYGSMRSAHKAMTKMGGACH
jgi:hypothetical protein